MPSSYTPPDVYVTQVRRTVQGAATLPIMPVVIVGLARQIETRAEAALTYDPRVSLDIPLPNVTSGALVNESTIKVLFDVKNGNESLGLFELAPADYATTADVNGNITGLHFDAGIVLDRSILSSRNNDQPNSTTNDDFAAGVPSGILLSDTATDFLAKGTVADGNSYVVISSPASCAGTYRILELIPTNNKVHQIIVEKVTDQGGGNYVPDLVASLTLLQFPHSPLSTSVFGGPSTHEAVLFDGAVQQITPTPTTGGVGVVSSPGLINAVGGSVASWGSTEINDLTPSGTILNLPGRQYNLVGDDEIVFAPVLAAGGAPDTVARALPHWRQLVNTVLPNDWIRVSYASTGTDTSMGTITGIDRVHNTITVTTAPGTAYFPGYPFTVTIAAGPDFAGTYAVSSVNGQVVTLTTTLAGTSTTPSGTATLNHVPAHLRDFKVLSVDKVNWAVTVQAAGGTAPLPHAVIVNPGATKISSIQLYRTFIGRGDNVNNGAGDYLVYLANGVEQRIEVLSASPTRVATVASFTAFTATTLATATNVTLTFTGPSTVVATGFSGLIAGALNSKYITIAGATNAGNNGTFPILASGGNTTNSITFTNTSGVNETGVSSAVAFDAPNAEVTMRRGIPFRNVTVSYDLRQQQASNFTANILVDYTADRHDLPLSGLIELGSRYDIQTQIGTIHPNNPLALGCDMVVRSGLADGNRTFYALATAGDTLDGFLNALDTLLIGDVYHVVPLTQDPAIIAAYKAHVDEQSQPANKHERVLYANTALPSYSPIIPTAGGVAPSGTFLSATTFQSTNADWGSVKPGNELKILVSPNTATESVEITRRVLSISGTVATLLSAVPSNYVGTTRAFRVDSFPFNKDEQAIAWRDEAKSYDDFRVTMIRPSQVEITYTDETAIPPVDRTVTVPGYYLAAAFAGLAGALPVESPLTNVPVQGINRIIHSNDYFNPAQLNTIAEGGNNIMVQSSRNSLPTSRQQLSTDMLSIITREWSITKIVDYTAKAFRNSLRPFIGNRNLSREYLTQLRGTSESIIKGLIRSNVLMPGTSIISLTQNPDEPDSVVVDVAIVVPYPCNRIYVTLIL